MFLSILSMFELVKEAVLVTRERERDRERERERKREIERERERVEEYLVARAAANYVVLDLCFSSDAFGRGQIFVKD
jgi:hypothetical protein